MREDTSSEHFDWLVDGRARNQRSTVALYRAIETHDQFLQRTPAFQEQSRELAAVAFSLWRAVFLSDLTGDVGDQLADLRRFLRSLLAHNAVLYQTDFNSREWAFGYYLDNAILRLRAIASRRFPAILPDDDIARAALSSKDAWSNAQTALDIAIANFAKALAAHDPA